MKISFWIPAVVIHAVSIALSNSVQVGTVLFTTTDLVRRCWTENDKSVLRARLIMQDLLPDPDCIDFSNPKAAVVLLDYFLACFEIINRFCYGKVQSLMYTALSDALGGYLKAFVLPSAKRGYYAGQIKYNEAEQLFRLYDNIRIFLKTNGGGWAEPQKLSRRKFHVSPLVITGGSFEACKQLRFIEKKGKLHRINPHHSDESPELKNIETTKDSKQGCPEKKSQGFKNSTDTFTRKRSSAQEGHEEKGFPGRVKKFNCNGELGLTPANETGEFSESSESSEIPEKKKDRCRTGSRGNNTNFSKRLIVPLPMLDDCRNPQSIAVPFKNRPFRNLHSASSAFILEYYYMAVIKCLIAAGNTRTDIKNFNLEFHSWLVSQVLPHLNDDQWYPGFGGVLRIVETIKKFGVEPGLNEPSFHDASYVFGKGVPFGIGDGKEGKDQPRNIAAETSPNAKRQVITAILVVSLLWMFLFCACAFYSQATRGQFFLNDGNSRTCIRMQSTSPDASNKSMSFQFLVRFFKKKRQNGRNISKDKEKKVCWDVNKLDNEKLLEEQSREDKTPVKKNLGLKLVDEPGKTMQGQGDFRCRHEEFFKPILPCWPSQYCFVKNKIKSALAGDVKATQREEQPDKITTVLWKKPSIRFAKKEKGGEDDDKKSSWEQNELSSGSRTSASCRASYSASAEDSKNSMSKQDACSCCSGSCRQISTSGTDCSSRSKVKKILSSITMECFEDIKAKRKPFIKSVILASTEESECDDEASTSYESDY